jgi:hypothetical protein
MTDPQRLKDEYAGDLQGQLLRSVASDAPRRTAHQRTLVALGFGGAALGIPSATTAAAATKVGAAATFAVIAKWVGIGMATAVVAAGAAYEAPRLMGRGESSVAAPIDQAPGRLPVGEVNRAPAPSPLQASESSHAENALADENPVGIPAAGVSPPPAPRLPRSVPTAARDTNTDPPSPSPRVEAPEPPGLSREVAMLDSARQMVSTNPAGTLRALDDYQSQFPHGDLAPEALVLRIEALVRSGQQPRADKLAREYLERNPGSPHARKIRTLLGGPAGSSQ